MRPREQVIGTVCRRYGIDRAEFYRRTKVMPVREARQVAALILHEAGWSWRMIAEELRTSPSAAFNAARAAPPGAVAEIVADLEAQEAIGA